ncbi:hypothetical protein ACFL38_04640 [Candidatus Omnitrophota bacterium]
MTIPKWIKPLFTFAGLYDFILGALFVLAPINIFVLVGVEPPNHIGYIQFPALLLVVFGIMFFAIARDPEANRNLIPYGILLKISYCTVVFSHAATRTIPDMWIPFAWIDVLFLAAFIAAIRALKQ